MISGTRKKQEQLNWKHVTVPWEQNKYLKQDEMTWIGHNLVETKKPETNSIMEWKTQIISFHRAA
jgi:lipid A disaccharide synthetase